MRSSGHAPRLLAISSGGGHWVQLRRLVPAFEGYDVTYCTVDKGYNTDDLDGDFRVVLDANRWNKFRLLVQFFQIIYIVGSVRPHAVISTGAAPGAFAIALSRLIGARTMWVDSIANAEHLSFSGRLARHVSHRCLTQWPELAAPDGPEYLGAVF